MKQAVKFQDTHPHMDLRVLGPYNLCLPDGRMKSRSYVLNEGGIWANKVQYFGENSVENICREDEEW